MRKHSWFQRGLTAALALGLLFACDNPTGDKPKDTGGETSSLSAPTASAAAASSTSITLSWSSVSGAASYIVYRSGGATGPFSVRASSQTGNSYSDSSLTASTTYYYRVSAVAGAVESPQSAIVSATTQAAPTTPVIGLSVSSLSASATVGGSSPAAQTASVTNAGSGSLTGLSSSVTYTNGSGWLNASLSSTSAPSTLTASFNSAALSAGSYSATIRVSSSVSGVAYKTIAVSLTVSSAATYTLSASVNPSGAGSVTRSPNSSSYASGTVVTVTATPNSGYVFSSWSGAATGSANPTTVTMNANKTLTANFTAAPVVPMLSAPSSATSEFQASMGFAWPGIGSTDDRYELEASYTQSSGYFSIFTGANGVRTNPMPVYITPDASDVGKTLYLRARVRSSGSYSGYSQVRAVSIPNLAMNLIADADNTLIYNSANSSVAATVYSSGDVSVGTNYFYNMAGLGGYINTAAAIRFSNLSTYISGRTINKATLIFQVDLPPGDFNGSYAVNAFSASWNPSTLTFNNRPNCFTANGATSGAPTTSVLPWSFDVTNIVRAWASGSWANNGFYLRDANITPPGYECYRVVDLLSTESGASYAPRLYIEVY